MLNFICKQCTSMIAPTTVKGYLGYCPCCDADKYSFECEELNGNFRIVTDQLFNKALQFELSKYSHINFVYTADNVPSTGKAIHAMWQNALQYAGNFLIFNGANSAENLYFSPETNLLYRSLHDVHHAEAYSIGLGGTTKIKDEMYLNCKMAYTAFSFALAYVNIEIALQVFFAVYHDTVGQVEHYARNKDFIVNQKESTINLLNTCKGIEMLKLGRVSCAKQVMIGYMKHCNFIG